MTRSDLLRSLVFFETMLKLQELVLLSIVFIARRDDFNIPHSPKRQRGDGFSVESVPALTLGVIRPRVNIRWKIVCGLPLCGAGCEQL